MCVAALAYLAHPRWRLVAIGNRDEYHARSAAPLAAWGDGSGILAGRDLQSGGTWLGVSPGHFALVTNRRGFGEAEPSKASRGALVTDALRGIEPENLATFNPFNLIRIDPLGARFLSNRPEPNRADLTPGIYGLSNGMLDEPWPKTLQLKAAVQDWREAELNDIEPLFAALRSEHLDTQSLPGTQPSDIPREAAQTPPFICAPIYGTRCSTVVTLDNTGTGTIAERSFDANGQITGEVSLQFDWLI